MKRTIKTIEFTWEETTNIAADRRRSSVVKRTDVSSAELVSDATLPGEDVVMPVDQDLKEEDLSQ